MCASVNSKRVHASRAFTQSQRFAAFPPTAAAFASGVACKCTWRTQGTAESPSAQEVQAASPVISERPLE